MGGTHCGRNSRLPAQYLRVACPTVVLLSCFACLVFRTIPRPSKATNTRGGLRLSMKTKIKRQIKQDEGVDEGNMLQELFGHRPNRGNKIEYG